MQVGENPRYPHPRVKKCDLQRPSDLARATCRKTTWGTEEKKRNGHKRIGGDSDRTRASPRWWGGGPGFGGEKKVKKNHGRLHEEEEGLHHPREVERRTTVGNVMRGQRKKDVRILHNKE